MFLRVKVSPLQSTDFLFYFYPYHLNLGFFYHLVAPHPSSDGGDCVSALCFGAWKFLFLAVVGVAHFFLRWPSTISSLLFRADALMRTLLEVKFFNMGLSVPYL